MSEDARASGTEEDAIDREIPRGTFVLLACFFIVAIAAWMNVYLQVLGRG